MNLGERLRTATDMSSQNDGDLWYPERLFPIVLKDFDLLGKFKRKALTPQDMSALVDMLRCTPDEITQSLVGAQQREAFALVMKQLKESNDRSGITVAVLDYVRGECSGKCTMKHMQHVLKTMHGVTDHAMQNLRRPQLIKMVSCATAVLAWVRAELMVHAGYRCIARRSLGPGPRTRWIWWRKRKRRRLSHRRPSWSRRSKELTGRLLQWRRRRHPKRRS